MVRKRTLRMEVHKSIEALKASQIPSIVHKMYFFPEAVSILSNLGIQISVYAVMYLILSYLMWLIFKKSYCRLTDSFYKWVDYD